MGASNALFLRSGGFPRKLLNNLIRIHSDDFKTEQGHLPLTFCVIYFMAWTWPCQSWILQSRLLMKIKISSNFFKKSQFIFLELKSFLLFSKRAKVFQALLAQLWLFSAHKVLGKVLFFMNKFLIILGTLLNYLFDTKFDVMSGEKRSQTTHGKTKSMSSLS